MAVSYADPAGNAKRPMAAPGSEGRALNPSS